MAVFDRQRKEISAKIVYYGPALSGKTTNLKFIYEKLKPEHRGKLMTLATQTDRTIFFDFLPIELGDIKGMRTRFQLYTVPGQVFYNSTRKMVLKNADGVVFVADSRKEALGDNLDSLKNLEENLLSLGIRPDQIPIVIQYNKQDLPTALPVEELEKAINPKKYPSYPAQAHKGVGVLETLTTICKLVIRTLKEQESYRLKEGKEEKVETGAPLVEEGRKEGDGGWEIVQGNPMLNEREREVTLPIRVRHKGEETTLLVRIQLKREEVSTES